MLYAFGFERVGVVAGDLYFVNPQAASGQQGAEHGVRLELRMLDLGALKGSAYSARPIEIGQPVWRADLLESVDGPAGSLDRAHHHPAFTGWNPGRRVYLSKMSDDPFGWLGDRLSDLDGLLASAGFPAGTAGNPAGTAGPGDAESLRAAAPEIVAVTRRLLDKVRAGELGRPPQVEGENIVRTGWL
jgi:hypothetical protein